MCELQQFVLGNKMIMTVKEKTHFIDQTDDEKVSVLDLQAMLEIGGGTTETPDSWSTFSIDC